MVLPVGEQSDIDDCYWPVSVLRTERSCRARFDNQGELRLHFSLRRQPELRPQHHAAA